MRRLRRYTLLCFGMLAAAVAVVVLIVMFSGPRMRRQPKYTAFEASFKPLPQGVVPVEKIYAGIPSQTQAQSMRNPLTPVIANINAGKVCYEYYCTFCHGSDGRGNGPAGESYMPAPSDLTNKRTAALSDGQLYRRMLIGAGHEPVLEYTILPEHRWYVITYLRYLQSGPPENTD